MLLGTFFLVLCTALVLDKLANEYRRPIVILISLCFLTTLWGTVESIFGCDQWLDPSFVKIERGGIPPDPGSRAATSQKVCFACRQSPCHSQSCRAAQLVLLF